MSIRILLADDHTVLRHGLSRSLAMENDFEVVAQADDGRTAVERVHEMQPDVVVMDISMPGLNGMDATRQIKKDCPPVKIIGLSMHSNDKYIREMFKAGASGYLLKNCPFEELTEAIRAVMDGKTYISPSIGEVIISNFVSDKSACEESSFSVLSQREREVLQLIAEGNTTKQIGRILHVSPKTVEAHRLRIMNKLGIDNIAQLTKYAIREGLTQPES